MRARHRRSRGQAVVEMALCAPLIFMVLLGTVDLARGYYLSNQITGAARAGMRIGITADTTDIGDAIRSEPNSAVPNTIAVWGNTGPPSCGTCSAQTYANCSGTSSACGDPKGCVDSSTWTTGQTACFAIRSCTLTNTAGAHFQCQAGNMGAWQTRPVPCTPSCTAGQQGPKGDGLDIVVVYKFQPASLRIATLTAGGTFTLRAELIGLELYY
ncbi:MAG TPA: TadE/TadG family type IV pilus assembly protein [Candidatus Dormibacteraeota bacterium]|jgi:Flp pilus assembly protein TadG|nr:TadE/TadG family type IV pilus assembly protein [Candidatus Dormibacteraeota bacterium]